MKEKPIYEIVYFQDEASINATSCKQPWFCVCGKESDGVKCGYPAEEAQQKIIKYYEDKAEWLKKLTPQEFLWQMGIYTDENV